MRWVWLLMLGGCPAPEGGPHGIEVPVGDVSAEAIDAAIARSQHLDLCAYDLLSQAPHAAYVWALCIGDYGMSAPFAVDLAGTVVTGVHTPGDGGSYGPDIARMFPREAQERMFKASYERQTQLEARIRAKSRKP